MQLPSPLGTVQVLPSPTIPQVLGVIGYNSGQGLQYNQATNKGTTIQVTTPCGDLITQPTALAAATIVSFIVTCPFAATGMIAVVGHFTGGTVGAYTVTASRCGPGSFQVFIRNNTGGSLSESLQISYMLLSAPNS